MGRSRSSLQSLGKKPTTSTLVLPVCRCNSTTVRKYYSRIRDVGYLYIQEGGGWRRLWAHGQALHHHTAQKLVTHIECGSTCTQGTSCVAMLIMCGSCNQNNQNLHQYMHAKFQTTATTHHKIYKGSVKNKPPAVTYPVTTVDKGQGDQLTERFTSAPPPSIQGAET